MNQAAEQINLEFHEEEERKIIRSAYRQLLKCIKTEMTAEDRENIRNAFEIAVEAHQNQRRKSGEPYILHPIEVARICAEEIGLGPTAIVAALLHDVVEDTDVTLDDIEQKFGKKIAVIVDGLTKIDKAEAQENQQAENFKKILGTLIVDVRIVLIKMADRLHNMRTLDSMKAHKQLKIAAETEYIYAPLAHRLGLYNIKTEFQDLCLKITHRPEYDNIAKQLAQTRTSRNAYIANFIAPIEEALKKANIKCRVFGRPKSIYSIYNKLKIKNVPIEEIYDLFAIRIVVDSSEQSEKPMCWHAYSIVTDLYEAISGRFKDWMTLPKSNGYESLHITVVGPERRFVEVQIRSERMDAISERGYAAHWKYKEAQGIGQQPTKVKTTQQHKHRDVFQEWLDSVSEMIKANNSGSTVDFVQDFKTSNLFTEEVFVYTPSGDLKVLPKGATALDFAFSIHSDIGYHAKSIKVNGVMVPMGQKLVTGDQISIITHSNQKPNESWLKMVVTAKAREKIRQALREEQRKISELGKEALQRKLDHMKVDFENAVDMLSRHFGYRTRIEFYIAISNNVLNLSEDLKSFKVEKGRLVLIETEKTPPLSTAPTQIEIRLQRPNAKTGTNLYIDDQPASLFDYTFAECCHPLPGDEIFAYNTSNNIYKIHQNVCPNATNLMANYSYRIRRATWGAAVDASFTAELLISGVDTGIGVIERLSSKISSEMGLNIRSFSIEGNQGYFEGRVKLVVANKTQLNEVIHSLKKIEGVSNVIRLDKTIG